MRRLTTVLFALALLASAGAGYSALAGGGANEPLFQASTECIVCHNDIFLKDGTDVSIPRAWSASMMANAARDPYWQAGVRRETMEHPEASVIIQGECSRCHMPMSHHLELNAKADPLVLTHLPLGTALGPNQPFAADGVSCTVCHQIEPDNLGADESFSGHFAIAPIGPGARQAYGPIAPDVGLARLMESAVGYSQKAAEHIQESSLCATCHTLFTHAVGYPDHTGPAFPEQVPFLEWRHSDYVNEMSCQSCHMPQLNEKVAVASTMGREHDNVSEHVFLGGNFVLPQLFRRFGAELAVTAQNWALKRSEERTRAHLQASAATLAVRPVSSDAARLIVQVDVANLAGHKLPSAYPSRRAWLHVKATDDQGTVLLESGALQDDGSIAGNDNDADGATYERHYDRITSSEEVQIYEDIMGTPDGAVTTGLLKATQYLKDNRLLPDGFDKTTAPRDVAVAGAALEDASFVGGSDTVTYEIPLTNQPAVVTVSATLYYQPIGYRWAHNLAGFEAMEPQRFVRYFKAIAPTSAVQLATTERLFEHVPVSAPNP